MIMIKAFGPFMNSFLKVLNILYLWTFFLQSDTMCAMTRNGFTFDTFFSRIFFISSYLQVNFLEFCHVIFTIFFSYLQVINKALQLFWISSRGTWFYWTTIPPERPFWPLDGVQEPVNETRKEEISQRRLCMFCPA